MRLFLAVPRRLTFGDLAVGVQDPWFALSFLRLSTVNLADVDVRVPGVSGITGTGAWHTEQAHQCTGVRMRIIY